MRPGLILIVDDEPTNLQVAREILSPHYSLIYANNGKNALVSALKHQPSLILMDIDMPDLSGYEVCKQLKNQPETEDIPVIFVSNLNEVGHEMIGFESGAIDYIVKPISPPILIARVKAHLSTVQLSKLEKSYRSAVYMLGTAGHFNDNDTGVHIWRMAAYARKLAESIGWNETLCKQIELAAPMHDTGKMGIPGQILRKPGKLDAAEWEVMKTHTTIGYSILNKSDAELFQMAAQIALRHHEKWDGSGYPDNLKGEAIPQVARIVAIADVFDALTMERPYKKAWPVQEALSFIQDNSGQHFDPELVPVFLNMQDALLQIKDRWEQAELSYESGHFFNVETS